MAIVAFDSDQLMEILAWLEAQREAGLTIEDVIEGIERGYLTNTVTVTDGRYSGNSSKSEQNSNLSRVSEEV